MNVCDDGHQEICHEGRLCPVCTLRTEVEELENKITDLEQQLEEARQ